MSFADNLSALPDSEGTRLRLRNEDGIECAVIENAPGTAGSFKLYAHLASKFDNITPQAARLGIELYAEHTEDARQNPGKHPNIDRLLDCIASKTRFDVLIERD